MRHIIRGIDVDIKSISVGSSSSSSSSSSIVIIGSSSSSSGSMSISISSSGIVGRQVVYFLCIFPSCKVTKNKNKGLSISVVFIGKNVLYLFA
jgi:hypothetical protein